MNSTYHNLTKRYENLWKIEQNSPDHKILRNMIVCNQVWGEPVIRIGLMGKRAGCQTKSINFGELRTYPNALRREKY
jgi:hypothetical protein